MFCMWTSRRTAKLKTKLDYWTCNVSNIKSSLFVEGDRRVKGHSSTSDYYFIKKLY